MGTRLSMADGDIHVVKDGDNWTVTIEAVQGVLVSFDTFDEAVRRLRPVASPRRAGYEFVLASCATAASTDDGA